MLGAKLKSWELGEGEACVWGETGFEEDNKHKEKKEHIISTEEETEQAIITFLGRNGKFEGDHLQWQQKCMLVWCSRMHTISKILSPA